MIAFVQAYGLHSPGGSSRILRALLSTAHPSVISINTGPSSAPADAVRELHLPLRRNFGRIEQTRLSPHFRILDRLYAARFQQRLARILRDNHVQAVHLIHHSYDIVPISALLRDMDLPLFLTIHDDFQYLLRGHPWMRQIEQSFVRVWDTAAAVFVISEEMGIEYSQRYGKRPYEMVTDGLTNVVSKPRLTSANRLRLYFMGLFLYNYRENFRSLIEAAKLIRVAHPEWEISIVCRCGLVPGDVLAAAGDVPISVLPFASEQQVEEDMLAADLLYQPLPFQPQVASFGKFSLSTKMITYLGSGLPIFYHGPENTAACQLLQSHRAAVTCKSLAPEEIAKELTDTMTDRQHIAANALSLARSRFMLVDQQERFWGKIHSALEEASSAKIISHHDQGVLQ